MIFEGLQTPTPAGAARRFCAEVRAAALLLVLLLFGAAGASACAGGDEAPLCDVPTVDSSAGGGGTDSTSGAPDGAAPDDVGGGGGEDVGTVAPRAFGAPCRQNADCDSGWCVPFDGGFICSESCVQSCPTGWECRGVPQTAPDIVFVCFPTNSHLCQPCVSDFECGDGFCLVVGDDPDEHNCGRSCSVELPCPDYFRCEPSGSLDGERVGDMCVPVSRRCDCTAETEGLIRACSVESDLGVCWGVETCAPEHGWIDCTARAPALEDCNGLDDDCDGVVDESPVPPAEPCERTVEGVGTCTATWACHGANGWSCEAPEPASEACNGRDDDCDGDTDEDFIDAATGLVVHPDHCATCGRPCAGTVPHGTTHCAVVDDAAACVLDACAPGWYPAEGVCLPSLDRVCQRCEDDGDCGAPGDRCLTLEDGQGGFCGLDCSSGNAHGAPEGECREGYTCEDLGEDGRQCLPRSGSCSCRIEDDGATRGCEVQNDHGRCLGVETCGTASGWSACDAATPTAEVCNGQDDDCSGVVDDLPGRFDSCANENEHGSCPGVLDCEAGAADLTCRGAIPAADTCNYRDDDCDGLTDESFPSVYAACADGEGQCRRFGVVVCSADGAAAECSVQAGDPADEVCDGLDNDCDGATDEGPLWSGRGTQCSAGFGQCTRYGVWACDAADPAGPVVCSATPLPPEDEVCDGADNDCDGETDEGWLGPDGYLADASCGNCFTDCTTIYAKPGASGACCGPDDAPACDPPTCRMVCDADRHDLNLVPDDGCEFALDADAIYVSASDPLADDEPGCGRAPTQTGAGWPCRTVAQGLAEADTAGRRRVLVADGLYEETVTLAAGVDLLGGYRPDTWERHVESTLTVLRGADEGTHRSTVFARAVTRASGADQTVFEGFVVYGTNAATPGGNAHAVFLVNCDSALVVRHNVIWAGTGAPAIAGAPGVSGQRGSDGAAGTATFSTRCEPGEGFPNGGAGGAGSCLDPETAAPGVPDHFTDVGGGRGGHAVCPDREIQAGDGVDGRGLAGPGAGGAGGWGHSTSSEGCSVTSGQPELGADGGDGAGGPARDGAGGPGCVDPFGAVSGTEWRGTSGGTGTHGAHGTGGGGGGAGSGQKLVTVDPWVFDVGGSGGGGAAGGCAGASGQAGGAGGGSFGVLVVFSPGLPPFGPLDVPAIHDNWIRRNVGGAGGDGGAGGVGGEGGSGGAGGALDGHTGPIYCVFPGAHGGDGGRGGHGGGGGGGCGGISFDIGGFGMNGVDAGWASANEFALPEATQTGGAAGAGGASQNTTDGAGSDGSLGAWGTVLLRD